RVVAPLDELALHVRLAALHGQLELASPVVDPPFELGDREAAVERRVAPPDDVEVDAVQNDHAHVARCYLAISSSSARRTSPGGSGTSQTGPASSRRTSRSSPAAAFLSRCMASQALSRSTLTGWG